MNPLDGLSQRDESKGEFISRRRPPSDGITMNNSKPTNAYANYILILILILMLKLERPQVMLPRS